MGKPGIYIGGREVGKLEKEVMQLQDARIAGGSYNY